MPDQKEAIFMTKNAWNQVSANTIDYYWKHTGKLLIVNVLLSQL